MLKIFINILFATLLSAQSEQNSSVEADATAPSISNPKVFSVLGDVVYNNAPHIEKLTSISNFSNYKQMIELYVKDVKKAKKMGYDLESNSNASDKHWYLKKVRSLAKTNDIFSRKIIKLFQDSMVDKNNKLFEQTINSGLLDTDRYKSKILDYHYANFKDTNATGIVKKYLDKDKKLKEMLDESKTKEQRQKEKIKRIRQNDIEKQAATQKRLENELLEKKDKIRQEQIEKMREATSNI